MPEKKSKQKKQSEREKPRRPAKSPPKPAMVIRRNESPRPAIPAPIAAAPQTALAHRNAGNRQSGGKGSKSSARRRNAAPRQQTAASNRAKPIRERIARMGMSHVATKTGSELLGNALAILVVGKGWLGPKTAAGILAGTGVATAAAGYAMEADHVMVAGTGLAHVGLLSLTNTVAVQAFQAHEKRALEKRQAEARQLAEADRQKAQAAQPPSRNARRLVILDADGNLFDEEEYAAA